MNMKISHPSNAWYLFDEGRTLGQTGSEEGTIIRDEERLGCARITLERNTPTAPFAITCGAYNWMVHTRYFADETKAQEAYEEMKLGLDAILALVPAKDEATEEKLRKVTDAVSDFIYHFP